MARPKTLILKRNDLVEAVFTSHPPSLAQNRILLWLASQVRHKEDEEFAEHQLTLAQAREIVGYNITLKELKKEIKDIMQVVGETYSADDGWLLFHIIDRAQLCDKTNIITIQLGSDMLPYFLRLNEHLAQGIGFTALGYEQMAAMKSVYSQRIFELLMQYRAKGKRTIDIEDGYGLKQYLGLISKAYLTRFAPLSRILNAAQEECAEHGLLFSWKPQKTGKKITAVTFDFEVYEGAAADPRLLAAGLSKLAAIRIMEHALPSQIDSALIALEKGRKTIKSPAAFLTKQLLPKTKKERVVAKAEVQKHIAEEMGKSLTTAEVSEMFAEFRSAGNS